MKTGSVRLFILVLMGWALGSTSVVFGQDQPTTAPTQAQGISDDARQVLDAIKQAYANLQTLVLAGDVTANFDVAGQTINEQTQFTSSFQAPNLFRHEMKDDIVIGSTGAKAYLFHPGQNVYMQVDAVQERPKASDLPGPVAGILQSQNPSLLMAVLDDAGEDLFKSSDSIVKGQDTTLNGATYATLEFDGQRGHLTMLVDPQTHLVRQAKFDLRNALIQSGQSDVKSALVTVNYLQSDADAAVDAAQFAWTPPENAKDLTQQAEQDGGGESALKGQPAPDFTLNDLNDQPVKLSDLQGSVVVLDFWATWCGPCVASMPNLQKLYDEKSPEGLKLYTVNIREDKAKVSEFLKSKNLTFPVLFDSDGAVADKYGVQGIPFTLVVGKDGVVREVMVGMGPETDSTLRAAVESAMAE